MSEGNDLFEMEGLDDTKSNSINQVETSTNLQNNPMSMPAPVKKKVKKAKINMKTMPNEVRPYIHVFDRYGQEVKNITEFDPNTFEGKQLMEIRAENGKVTIKESDVYLFNAYVVADGYGYPDEEEIEAISNNVKDQVRLKGFVETTSPQKIEERKRMLDSAIPPKLQAGEKALDKFRCYKCNSMVRYEDQIESGGRVVKAIVCTNGSCGNRWHNVV